jgi:hypothetical protein
LEHNKIIKLFIKTDNVKIRHFIISGEFHQSLIWVSNSVKNYSLLACHRTRLNTDGNLTKQQIKAENNGTTLKHLVLGKYLKRDPIKVLKFRDKSTLLSVIN